MKSKLKVYDKVKWHSKGGKVEKRHIELILKWLNEKNLLSTEGKEVLNLGINIETSIHSGMLTNKGISIMDKCYDKYLSNYDIKSLERCSKL